MCRIEYLADGFHSPRAVRKKDVEVFDRDTVVAVPESAPCENRGSACGDFEAAQEGEPCSRYGVSQGEEIVEIVRHEIIPGVGLSGPTHARLR